MRAVLVHGVLALGGLVAAYTTWTREENAPTDAASVVVFECDARELEAIALKTKNRDTTLTRRRTGTDYDHDVRVVERRDAMSTERSFVANKNVGAYVARFAPLRALRSLGAVASTRLEELGLASPEETLEVRCGNQTKTFELGGATFGAGERYAKLRGTSEVILLPATLVSELGAAEFGLMQNELVGPPDTDVDSVVLELEGRRRELRQLNRRVAESAEWVDARAPTQRDETFGNLLERVRRLRAQEYLAEGQNPTDAKPVATLTYRGGAGTLDVIEVVRVDGDGTTYYARSRTTRRWTKVLRSAATEFETDVRAFFELEPRPPLEPAAPDAGPPAAASDGGVPSAGDAGVAPADPHAGHAHP